MLVDNSLPIPTRGVENGRGGEVASAQAIPHCLAVQWPASTGVAPFPPSADQRQSVAQAFPAEAGLRPEVLIPPSPSRGQQDHLCFVPVP